jgi:hypothetical protein
VRNLSAMVEKKANITALAEVTESAISHHMRGMWQLHIVRARSHGKEVFYSIIDPHIVALFPQGLRHVQE